MKRSERVISFIERYLRVPEGPLVGKPIVLDEFQKKFIIDVYDNPHITREAILSIARKNGKTAFLACLVMVHLVGPEALLNSQIASGAMSKENAALLFKAMSKMIALNPELQAITRVVPSQKQVFGLPMNTEYQALSKDGKTNMGGSPVVLVLDETGQVVGASDDFIDAVTTSQGAHDAPIKFVISTQAARDGDLLSIWIDDALSGKDPQKVCHLYAADADCDILDEKAWYASNPALGIFRNYNDMKTMANNASRMPSFENAFRNLYLNQRISVNSPFISRNAWLSCAAEVLPMDECEFFYGGLDLSAKTDLTAFVLIGWHSATSSWQVYTTCWTPSVGLQERAKNDRAPYDVWVREGHLLTTPSATIDYDFVAQEIVDLCDGRDVRGIAFDRWRIDVIKAAFERIVDNGGRFDVELLPWGQGFKDMAPALDALEGRILNAQIRHGAQPVLTMCAANAMVTRDPSGNRKLDKSKTSGRIDAMVALAMACGLSERGDELGDFDGFLSNPLIL